MATINSKKVKKVKKSLPCTIDPILWESWMKMRRFKDTQKIAERFTISRPTVDNAFNFGHVLMQELVGYINTFYQERIEEERKQGEAFLEK